MADTNVYCQLKQQTHLCRIHLQNSLTIWMTELGETFSSVTLNEQDTLWFSSQMKAFHFAPLDISRVRSS